MTPAEIIRRLELDALYADYAHCLDNDALEEWPKFFTDDCGYRIISAENFEAGLPLGIVYATSKAMLVDRVMALRKANIYEPQRYRHMVGAIRIGPWDDDEAAGALAVTANVIVVRTMQDGAMMLFAGRRMSGMPMLSTVGHARIEPSRRDALFRGLPSNSKSALTVSWVAA